MHWTTAVSEEKMSQSTANTHSVFVAVLSLPTCLLLTLRPAWQIKIRAPSSVGPPRRGSPLDAGAAVLAGVRVFVQPCTDRKNTWEWRPHVSCGAHGKTNHPGVTGRVGKVFLSACDGVQWSLSKSGWSCISVCSLSLRVFKQNASEIFAESYFFMALWALQISLKYNAGRKDDLPAGINQKIHQIPGWNCRNMNRWGGVQYNVIHFVTYSK